MFNTYTYVYIIIISITRTLLTERPQLYPKLLICCLIQCLDLQIDLELSSILAFKIQSVHFTKLFVFARNSAKVNDLFTFINLNEYIVDFMKI